MRLPHVILASVLLLTCAFAQTGAWTLVQPPTSPPFRSSEGLAFEPVSGAFVVYGGGGTAGVLADTYVFDGCSWIQIVPATSPGLLTNLYLAASPNYASVVLFGGNPGTGGLSNATWEFSTATLSWANVSPAGPSPSARELACLAYDSARSRTVLFGGGSAAGGTFSNETWEWDGTSWFNVTPAGPNPAPRAFHSMTYDAARARTVVYGGYNGAQLGDTWEWDGLQWTQIYTAASPGPRSSGAIAYDPWSQRVVLFAGSVGWPNGMNDTWEYDGVNWSLASVAGPSPANQYLHRMAGDAVRGGVLVYGAYGDNWTPLNDTWRYQRAPLAANTLTPPIGSLVNYSLSLPNEPGFPYIAAISLSGTCPGALLPDGRIAPLNVDVYTNISISNQFPSVFQGFSGTLSASGLAFPVLAIPGIPSLIGLAITTAAVTASGPGVLSTVTNAVTVVLQ
jgi:Galactose oxidase, central domain